MEVSLKAQDLIVTGEGDSLNCKITRIQQDYIYFTFKYKNEIRNTLLPVNEIKNYQINYFQNSEVPTSQVLVSEMYPHWRFSLNGGWSYRIARLSENVSSDYKSYVNGLRSGFHFGLDLTYYFIEEFGIGLIFNDYFAQNEMNNDNSSSTGKNSDKISINFIGPSFSTRLFDTNKKSCFIMNFGFGYMGYNDQNIQSNQTKTYKGNTVGLCMDIGYDFGISKKFAIGFQFSIFTGTLTSYKYSDGTNSVNIKLDKDQYENLSKIALSVGIRFMQ
jgi:hypothetical protein